MFVYMDEIDALRQALADESSAGFFGRRQAAQSLARLATGANGQETPFSPAEARAVVEGLVAGLESVHWGPHLTCRHALERLKDPQLKETVCEIILEQDLRRLNAIAVQGRYAPQDPLRRAAYLYVLGISQFYEAHDPKGKLLEQFYMGAPSPIRDRILGSARKWGDPRWVRLIAGFLHSRGGTAMSEVELGAAVEMLNTERQWEELWALALECPLPWSWQGVRTLAEEGWQPQDARATACWKELVTAVRAVENPAAVVKPAERWRTALSGPGSDAFSLAISPDGATLANNGWRSITLWDLPGRQKQAVLQGLQNWVTSLAISPDGATLASGSRDGTIILWDLPSRQRRTALQEHQGEVSSLTISPDGATLASSSWDQTIILWDLSSGQLRTVLRGHQREALSLAISPDGTTLASGNGGGTIILWNLPRGQKRAVLRGHQREVYSLAINPGGTTLASGGGDAAIILWDLPSGRQRAALKGHQNAVVSLAISPDGATLASSSRDGAIILWDLPGESQRMVLREHQGRATSLAISPDGTTLVSGNSSGTIDLWDRWDVYPTVRVPLGQMTRQDLERVKRFMADGSFSSEQQTVARYMAAMLRYRLGEEGQKGQ